MVNIRPSELHDKLIPWYHANRRDLPWRNTKDPYCIWVSEVMLQQTQVSTVVPYYRQFMIYYPDIPHLASAPEEDILKRWEGLGYYARARNLLKAAGEIAAKYDGKIPDQWDLFRSLPGVGDYIASAVLSIAHGAAYAVVDGNVKRVMARLFCIDDPVNQANSHKVFSVLAKAMLEKNDPGTYNQAVMELGALICKPKTPACDRCPVSSLCGAHKNAKTDVYPVRIKAKKTPVREMATGIIYKKNKLLIIRRPSRGLLGGLWEFPGGQIRNMESTGDACIRTIAEKVNLNIEVDRLLTRVDHAYTHFKIKMDVFTCEYISGRVKLNGPMDFRWVSQDSLTRFPFHKAIHKFFPHLIEVKNRCKMRQNS
ncbi:MAG: A/G-specific adenine glycosylase [Desulfobacteraceae bacterium]|nr:A/G-specific adenine glycosylase [Desulfobacteraceae bacterium]